MAAVQRPRPAAQPADPHISIVIPVYNEQAILHAAVVDLRERLRPLGWSYEVILAENGSKDRTVQIGHELDLCDADFHRQAIDMLESGAADLVIGSKLAAGSSDDRPLIRHAASI